MEIAADIYYSSFEITFFDNNWPMSTLIHIYILIYIINLFTFTNASA